MLASNHGKLVFDDAVDARVCEADRIDHALRQVRHAWSGIPAAGFDRNRLGHEPAERFEVHDLANSSPNPQVPAASSTGFWKVVPEQSLF